MHGHARRYLPSQYCNSAMVHLKSANMPATPVMREEKREARASIGELEDAFVVMSWRDLITYGERIEHVISPSGRRFRVKSYTFWDMEEFASGMECGIKVRPEVGWRRWWPYKGWVSRGGPDDWFEPHEVGDLKRHG
jgi:hypothetical protein